MQFASSGSQCGYVFWRRFLLTIYCQNFNQLDDIIIKYLKANIYNEISYVSSLLIEVLRIASNESAKM
jgi:hypothetical protein